MLGYLNKANEEEAVNGRTDRGPERGAGGKEACMNTATTNKGCYSSSWRPRRKSGAYSETTEASHFSFSIATNVQSNYFNVTDVDQMRRTSFI
jgi:hypothetical protein